MSSARPHLLVGWLVACAIAVALAIAASAWTRAERTPGASATPAERIADWLVAYVAIAIALVQLVGFAGWFRIGPVLLAAAACAAIGFARRGGSALRARIADLVACARALTRSVPLAAASAFGLALWVRVIAQREVSWDGLIYHLTYPAVWIQRGGFVSFDVPGIWEQFESFPKGAEALYALAMLPLRADDLTFFVHPVLWLGTGCAIYAAARRIGCPRLIAELAAACALGSPALGAFISPANVEIPVAFAVAAAASAATRALIAREPEALGPCVLALCLGAAIKVTSLAYLPLGLVVVLACARTAPLAACLRHAFRGAALGVVVALPWYANNVVQCDNPFYPAALPGARSGPAAGTLANAWVVRDSSVLAQRVVLDVLGTLARPPWAASYPGPGWLYLFAMLASTSLIVRLRFARRGEASTTARAPSGRSDALPEEEPVLRARSETWNDSEISLGAGDDASSAVESGVQNEAERGASERLGAGNDASSAVESGVQNEAERGASERLGAGDDASSTVESRVRSDASSAVESRVRSDATHALRADEDASSSVEVPGAPAQSLRPAGDTSSESTRDASGARRAPEARGGALKDSAALERPPELRAGSAIRLQLRAALVLAAAAWLLSVLYLVMPWNGIFWAPNTRFLTPALLIALLSVAALTASTPRWLTASTWAIAAAFTIASWCNPRFWTAIDWSGAPAAVALGFAHDPAQIRATAARGRFPRAAPLTRFWQYIDTLPPSRIAYAVGGIDAQEGWLFYPLFGSALQHDVRYIDVERVATRACRRRGMVRANLDEAAWLERLAAEHIQWFVISGTPQERRWIDAHPTHFALAYQAVDHRLYAVHFAR